MSYMMGIDVGTTGTRAVIVRPDGQVVGAATGDHEPMRMPKPSWAEQDPANWWEATIQAVRAALEPVETATADERATLVTESLFGPQQTLYGLLGADAARHIDDLVENSGLSSSETLAALFDLEMKGYIRQLPGKQFIRVML